MNGPSLRHALLALALLASACGAADRSAEEPIVDPLESVTGEELYRRGRLLARGGDLIRAEQYFAASIGRGYPEERVLPALMHVCIEASRLVAALQYAEPYLARHPDAWSLRMLVASLHMGMEHHTEARTHLERVLRDAPDEPPQAHYFLGVLFRDRLEDPERSATHFRRYLVLDPDGDHVDEARAGVSGDSAPSLPQRVQMPAAAAPPVNSSPSESGDP